MITIQAGAESDLVSRTGQFIEDCAAAIVHVMDVASIVLYLSAMLVFG